MLSFSHAANPRAIIVKCDGCAYYADVEAGRPYLHVYRDRFCVMPACFILLVLNN